MKRPSIAADAPVSTAIRTKFGLFDATLFTAKLGEQCLLFKTPGPVGGVPTVRIHSACLFGEALYSQECDCRQQLDCALEEISSKGGILVYLFQEGRGIGLRDKIKAMDFQEKKGVSTVQAFAHLGYGPDLRRFDTALQALQYSGIGKNIRLITNNPNKISALREAGFNIIERVEPRLRLSRHSADLLKQKEKALKQIPYKNLDISEI